MASSLTRSRFISFAVLLAPFGGRVAGVPPEGRVERGHGIESHATAKLRDGQVGVLCIEPHGLADPVVVHQLAEILPQLDLYALLYFDNFRSIYQKMWLYLH